MRNLLRVLMCLVGLGGEGLAQEPAGWEAWKTGPQFRQQLDAAIGVRWASNPLRPALANLSRNAGVAIFLDRRVDPDQKVDFEVRDMPLRGLLEKLAEQLQLGMCLVGPVVYLGPRNTAATLATVVALKAEESQRGPPAARSLWVATRRMAWPDLTTPRALVDQVAAGAGLKAVGLEQIPHDLWPAVDLPPLTLIQRLSLLLAGFDRTFEGTADGTTIELVPLPFDAVLERSYSVRGSADALIAQIQKRFPRARLSVEAGKLVLLGPAGAHEALEDALRGARPTPRTSKPAAKGTTVFTLRVENKPVGGIATALAKRLDRTVRFAPDAKAKLEELVSFDVKNATLDELLKAMLSPVGLDYELDEETLTIVPAR